MRKFISQEEYIKRCKKVWGDRYDLSQVVYTGSLNTVDVICRKHGIFHPNARNFTNGHGCPECQKDTVRAALTKTTDDFVKRAKLVHGDNYLLHANWQRRRWLTSKPTMPNVTLVGIVSVMARYRS